VFVCFPVPMCSRGNGLPRNPNRVQAADERSGTLGIGWGVFLDHLWTEEGDGGFGSLLEEAFRMNGAKRLVAEKLDER